MDVASTDVVFSVPLRSLLLTFHIMLLLLRGMKFERVILLSSLNRTIECRLAPRNPDGPPGMTPAWMYTKTCVGWEEEGGRRAGSAVGASQSCQTTRLKQDPRDTRSSAVLRAKGENC